MGASLTILFGLIYHAIGGFASASFYVPIKFIKEWRWEWAWLVMGVSAWICAPLIFASIAMPSFWQAICGTEFSILMWTFIYGVLWGIGCLSYGLAMRFLGVGLGCTVALGCCTVFGTLMPPIMQGKFISTISTSGGQIVMLGIIVCVLGIIINGLAGIRKDKEVSSMDSVPEGSLKKGFIIAVVSGILSACFAFGLSHGKPIGELAKTIAVENMGIDSVQASLYQNTAVTVVILWGGFLANFLWIIALMIKNKSFADVAKSSKKVGIRNAILAAVAGVTWYLQFFFYGMGESKMGEEFSFSSWSLHMSTIIIFAGIWGLVLKEWKGVSKRTIAVLFLGILTLIASVCIIGLGNYYSV